MKYKQNKEGSTITVACKLNAEEWNSYLQKAYEQNKGKYGLPGFRKGHIPRNILENRYGKTLFFEDALYTAAQEYYNDFLDKNSKVQPILRPQLDESSFKADENGAEFSIIVSLYPEVTLGQYKGLSIKKTAPVKVKADEVDGEINRIRERNARFEEVSDRAVAENDIVKLDYCGKVDGVAFDGGTATDYELTIGSHTFIPGFEEQLVGMNVGETKDIDVTFPEDYHHDGLKGKAAVFTCTIKGITVKQLPELDDEFAKDASEFSTMKEWKASVKKTLQDRNDSVASNEDEQKLLDEIVANSTMDIPSAMIENEIDGRVEEFERNLQRQGLNIQAYYKYTNSTEKDLRESYREVVNKNLRRSLVMNEIVKAEKIVAPQDKVDEEIKKYADAQQKDFNEFKASLTQDEIDYIKDRVALEEAAAFLKKENTIA